MQANLDTSRSYHHTGTVYTTFQHTQPIQPSSFYSTVTSTYCILQHVYTFAQACTTFLKYLACNVYITLKHEMLIHPTVKYAQHVHYSSIVQLTQYSSIHCLHNSQACTTFTICKHSQLTQLSSMYSSHNTQAFKAYTTLKHVKLT